MIQFWVAYDLCNFFNSKSWIPFWTQNNEMRKSLIRKQLHMLLTVKLRITWDSPGREVLSTDSVLPRLKYKKQNWILETTPNSRKFLLNFMHFPVRREIHNYPQKWSIYSKKMKVKVTWSSNFKTRSAFQYQVNPQHSITPEVPV